MGCVFMVPTTPDPTVDSIDKVKRNLRSMQAFNDYVYNNGAVFISNAYLLLTSNDNSDPGLTVGISLLEGAFGIVGSCGAVHSSCPKVYAWQFDDVKATFNCRRTNDLVDYEVEFCPKPSSLH